MTILKIDMSKHEIAQEPFPKDKMIGGRAMVDYLMTEYGSPTAHPLSEESLFIIAPGLLAGSNAPQSGRLSVGGKSPLTGGIKEANVGGTTGHKLGRLGIRAIVVKGKSQELSVMRVSAKGISLDNARSLIGLKNYEACENLRREYGNDVGIMVAGIAGEMKLANSTVAVTDPEGRPTRQAARGGLGSVMFAKGLKAIVIDDTGIPMRKAADPEGFKVAVKDAIEAINAHPLTKPFHTYGTNWALESDNQRGSLPTRNHYQGSFEKHENINANKLLETVKSRGGMMGHSCMPGCVVRCSSIYHDSKGEFLTASFDYETIAMLGSNLGIDDLDAIARMDRLCDELGIDTIELGCTIGILNEVGLFDFGDAKRAYSLIEEISRKSPLGRVLGSGVTIAAKIFGIDRIPAVKGQGIPAHSARSCKGWGVTYATSPQGADHTAGPVVDDFLSKEGQVQRSRMSQIVMAGLDSAGLCMFSRLMGQPEIVARMINGLYGINWSSKDYLEMAKEALRQERVFNKKAGMSDGQDRLPDWMRQDPLPPTNAVFDVAQSEIDELFNF
jgi:aldehyde:ferredoxin oxidoreductase